MRIIDIDNWKGKKHYLWFKKYPVHYYSLTSEVDITLFYHYIKRHNLPFFVSFMYLLTKALNEVEEFRLRVVDDKVVLYDVIHPAYTVMTETGVYDNCENDYNEDYNLFRKLAEDAITLAKKGINMEKQYNDYNRFDQFYYTSLPWIDFTSANHPMPSDVTVYTPRILWGKYKVVGDRVVINLNMQVSHALIDGYPLSQAYLKFQELVNKPEQFLR